MQKCTKCHKRPRYFKSALCSYCWKIHKAKVYKVANKLKNPPPSKGAKRRQQIKENGGSHTEKEWLELKEKYGNRCLRCGKKETARSPLTADHIIPVSLGGTSDISNIQILCGKCNSAKGARAIDYRLVSFPNV